MDIYLCEQTLMTVIAELDTTLFEGYVKPKSNALTSLIRNGILDPQMDWFDTPQPTGEPPHCPSFTPVNGSVICASLASFRNSVLHVRDFDGPCRGPCPSL